MKNWVVFEKLTKSHKSVLSRIGQWVCFATLKQEDWTLRDVSFQKWMSVVLTFNLIFNLTFVFMITASQIPSLNSNLLCSWSTGKKQCPNHWTDWCHMFLFKSECLWDWHLIWHLIWLLLFCSQLHKSHHWMQIFFTHDQQAKTMSQPLHRLMPHTLGIFQLLNGGSFPIFPTVLPILPVFHQSHQSFANFTNQFNVL